MKIDSAFKNILLVSIGLSFGASAVADTLATNDPSETFPELDVKDRYLIAFNPLDGNERVVLPPNAENKGRVPFGENTSGQSKEEVAGLISLNGEVLSIYDAINTIYVEASREEAIRLSRDPRVLYVEQDNIVQAQGVQYSPGWALDRLDESSPSTGDGSYAYTATGAGRKIYVLDSGLNMATPAVAAQFGSRASVIYDYNGSIGDDCQGHGSAVSSVAAGATHGVAKGATVVMAKITIGCTISAYVSTTVTALNWIATNEVPGTIINWSHGFEDPMGVCTPIYSSSLETAF